MSTGRTSRSPLPGLTLVSWRPRGGAGRRSQGPRRNWIDGRGRDRAPSRSARRRKSRSAPRRSASARKYGDGPAPRAASAPASIGCSCPRSMIARDRSMRRDATAVWAAKIIAAPLSRTFEMAAAAARSIVWKCENYRAAPRRVNQARTMRPSREIEANHGAYRALLRRIARIAERSAVFHRPRDWRALREYFLKNCLTALKAPPISPPPTATTPWADEKPSGFREFLGFQAT